MLSEFQAEGDIHFLYVDLPPIRAHQVLVPMCFVESCHGSLTTVPNTFCDLWMVIKELE
jgi:hypothetical protein